MTTINTEVWPTFEDFWNLYGKKISRPKCEKAWNKLSQADKESIIKHIPLYNEYLKIKGYDKKYPYTFLYNRSWEDELIPENHEQHTDNPLEFYRAFSSYRR